MNININDLIPVVKEAGDAIIEIYNSGDFGVEIKSDNSPLTKADKASHQIIKNRLTENYPGIPILSEEGKEESYAARKNWNKFWLVDPLDGTKEFVKRNGEFTVNIALIENGISSAGIIYAPVLNSIYLGTLNEGAYKQNGSGKLLKISVNKNYEPGIIIVKSRSHSSEEEEKILSQYNIIDSISKGSSLKFCMVAEGKAHLYYRHGPTWEWDTGAGHAIVESAGGIVEGLKYNKENLLNGSFLVKSFK